MTVERACPVCGKTYSHNAEMVATRDLAEHVRSRNQRGDDHRDWVETHTTSGRFGEIVGALRAEMPIEGAAGEPETAGEEQAA